MSKLFDVHRNNKNNGECIPPVKVCANGAGEWTCDGIKFNDNTFTAIFGSVALSTLLLNQAWIDCKRTSTQLVNTPVYYAVAYDFTYIQQYEPSVY